MQDSFLSKVEKTDHCWNWKPPPASNGYGQVMVNRTRWLAHRLAYTLFNGPIPEGKLVCHTCDNKLCVNPEHLYVGDHTSNNRDTYRRGRMPIRYGDAAKNVAKLTREQAIDIKYSGKPTKVLTNLYNINQSQVSRIKSNVTWKNI